MRLLFMLRVLLAATILCAAPAHAAISPGAGADGNPAGELFFTVWDATNQVSYTRDLGISILDFLANPNQGITRAPDPLYNSTFGGVNPSTLVYSVGAFNYRNEDFPCCFGMVISSSNPVEQVTLPDVTALATALSVGGFYVVGANANDGGDPQDFASNRSSVSHSGDAGYWGGENWNGNIGNTVPFTTGAAVGTSIAFYALLLDEDGFAVNTTAFSSMWTLAADGTLTYGAGAVPLPAAFWLLLCALGSVVGHSRRSRA